MKKTITALMAMVSAVFGADDYQKLWELDFTTLQRTGNSVDVTVGDYTFKVWDGTLDSSGITSDYTPAENGSSASIDRVHITGDTGVTWGDDFRVKVVFTIPEGYDYRSNWPSIFNMYGEDDNDNLRFGPYVVLNSYGIDGVSSTALSKPQQADWDNVVLTTGVQHTAELSIVKGTVTLNIDESVAAKGTLNQTDNYYRPDIAIDNMVIGGHSGKSVTSGWNMDVTVSSLAMYKVVPEPTTATLSLLALAGLAARRRRK